mgnify:FL=1
MIAFLFVTFLKRLSDEDEYYVVCIVSFYELLFNPAVNNISLSFSTRESTSEMQNYYYYYYYYYYYIFLLADEILVILCDFLNKVIIIIIKKIIIIVIGDL